MDATRVRQASGDVFGGGIDGPWNRDLDSLPPSIQGLEPAVAVRRSFSRLRLVRWQPTTSTGTDLARLGISILRTGLKCAF